MSFNNFNFDADIDWKDYFEKRSLLLNLYIEYEEYISSKKAESKGDRATYNKLITLYKELYKISPNDIGLVKLAFYGDFSKSVGLSSGELINKISNYNEKNTNTVIERNDALILIKKKNRIKSFAYVLIIAALITSIVAAIFAMVPNTI